MPRWACPKSVVSTTQRDIMNKRKTSIAPITWATLAVLALSGCASPLVQRDPAWMGYKPTRIAVVEKDDLSSYCIDNRATLGCSVRLRETSQCIVFVKSGLPYEAHGRVITGETRRCFGDLAAATSFGAR
jgi:hypothetical protein